VEILKIHRYLLDFGTLLFCLRITVGQFPVCALYCNNIPVMIGKAAKPRCFKNLKINNLPLILRNNKKVWMTAATMEEWLTLQHGDLNSAAVSLLQYFFQPAFKF
jgi:hypothetical protein